ncbi:MAG: hypothetical protein J6Y02_14450 [Pseudobutyrivibrio sp.]|nr:hypothetical protein [Pseudobutyrivibrio sp.]
MKRKTPGKPPNHSKVMNLETGDIFETFTEAAKAIGGDRTNVRRVAYGVQSHHRGYHFIFLDKNDRITSA